jgi:hypothetical protein
MRTEKEVRQVFDATYNPEITTLEPGEEDEGITILQDLLRWILEIDISDAEQFISLYIEG